VEKDLLQQQRYMNPIFAIPDKNIEIPTFDFWRNEITITSSYGAAPDYLEESLELIKNKKINVSDLILHKFPLTEIVKGFELVTFVRLLRRYSRSTWIVAIRRMALREFGAEIAGKSFYCIFPVRLRDSASPVMQRDIDKIIDHLKLSFYAERSPPPQVVQQELFMAAEES